MAPAGPGATAPPRAAVRSPLSDGEWHRMHPLTPIMRGGLVLIVVIGYIIANLRDRFIALFLPHIDVGDSADYEGDPIDFILANNLILVVLLAVLGVLLLLLALFWLSWRFHTFRITGDDVEVRSGVIFRSHRRAPLDRVQGVNLVRPMIARLLGMAKLEVVGAGLDANVKLEYLSTSNAETIRGDILRLASGQHLAAQAAAQAVGGPLSQRASAAVSGGLSEIIGGVDQDAAEPASVVQVPVGRIVASRLLGASTLWLLALVIAIIVGSIVGSPWVLLSFVPAIIGVGAYWLRQITQSLRYSIAPTSSGVRITFGLFTTTTETLPPGRVHALEISQPVLWRRFGWWTIRVNRLSGKAATDTSAIQFAQVLPVGTVEDVRRVLSLFLPEEATQAVDAAQPEDAVPPEDAVHAGDPASVEDAAPTEDAAPAADLIHDGMFGRAGVGDPFLTTPRRARWLRPLSFRRNGALLARGTLLMRSGVLRRALVILPLARLQSLRLTQGPVDRLMDVANLTGNTVVGPVSGTIGILDRTAALELWQRAEEAAVAAAAVDRSHRWDAEEQR